MVQIEVIKTKFKLRAQKCGKINSANAFHNKGKFLKFIYLQAVSSLPYINDHHSINIMRLRSIRQSVIRNGAKTV